MSLLPGKAAAVERLGSVTFYNSIAATFAEALPVTEKAIAEAMNRQEWDEARRLVHSLKSNCATMGADGVREAVYSLEKACASRDLEAVPELFASVCAALSRLREELLAQGGS